MTLIKWSPQRDIDALRRDIEKTFEDFFGEDFAVGPWRPFWRRRRGLEPSVTLPNIDMYDKKDEIVVKVELPGVEKDQVDITLSEDTLTVKGEAKREEEVKDEDYYRCERCYGSFSRTIELPVRIQGDKSKATFKNGILEIRLPKAEEAKPKEIKVEVK